MIERQVVAGVEQGRGPGRGRGRGRDNGAFALACTRARKLAVVSTEKGNELLPDGFAMWRK